MCVNSNNILYLQMALCSDPNLAALHHCNMRIELRLRAGIRVLGFGLRGFTHNDINVVESQSV